MKVRLQATVNKEFILKKIEECTDFYANEESNTLKELSDDMLNEYLKDCVSYILICYSNCITVEDLFE